MLRLANGNRPDRLGDLEENMKQARSYPEWLVAASEHDAVSGADVWKAEEDNLLYDAVDIRRRHDGLARAVQARDSEELLFTLNEGIHGNMGGMGNSGLYGVAQVGTKTLIDDYTAAIVDALEVVANAPEQEIAFAEKLDFFHRAALCYGRSALLLSGGGGLVYFHHGVVEALLDEGLLPGVLAGSSAGAWMCAQIGTRTEAELEGYFASKRYTADAGRAVSMMKMRMRNAKKDPRIARSRDEVIEGLVGDLTFAEAFEHSGRHINISIASADQHHRARLLNAITSPNVTLRSACRASSCIPQFVDPAMLEAKNRQGTIVPYLPNQRWIDGAFADDLPMKRLARLYGANHFIVSQINLASVVAPFVRSDRKRREGALHQSSQLFFAAMRETAKVAQRSLWPLSRTAADTFLGALFRLFEQDYSGDITIPAKFSRKSLNQAMFRYDLPEEIEMLIEEGRRRTWPRIEQIRTTTMISRALDRILARFDAEAADRCHPAPRRAGSTAG